MVAASADRNTQSKVGDLRGYGVAASQTIYKGVMVMLNSAGYLIPAAVGANNSTVVGVAEEAVKSGTVAGATKCLVRSGRAFRFTADSIAQTNVGDLMYALDDQTIDETATLNAKLAGHLVEYISATEGWVFIPSGGVTGGSPVAPAAA